jgi:hypothetical protein
MAGGLDTGAGKLNQRGSPQRGLAVGVPFGCQ